MRVNQGIGRRWTKDHELPVITVWSRMRRARLSHFHECLLQVDEMRG